MTTKDRLITDFTDPRFMDAFKIYFGELKVQIRDYDALFQEMNHGGENRAWLRTDGDGTIVGFIMFIPLTMSSWFFEERMGFIREFWIRKEFRGLGHGTALLDLAEQYFGEQGIQKLILTTDTAPGFYCARGYTKSDTIIAKNGDDVFIKRIC